MPDVWLNQPGLLASIISRPVIDDSSTTNKNSMMWHSPNVGGSKPCWIASTNPFYSWCIGAGRSPNN